MSKQIPGVEWYVAENDAEWGHLAGQPSLDNEARATATKGRHIRWFLWGIATLLFLLMNEDSERSSSPPELQQDKGTVRAAAEGKVEEVVQDDDQASAAVAGSQAAPHWQLQFAREYGGVHAEIQTDILLDEADAHVDMVMHPIEFWGEQVVALVIISGEHGAPAYRQTRFYQRMGPDWRQVAPNAALWGPERVLETPSFIFHFRQNDAQAVIAVAPQMEARYTTFRQHFGLPLTPGAEKPVIEVSVAQVPGYKEPWFLTPERILVPSPATYLAPVELTDAEILAQSLALPLLAQVSAQASEQYQIGAAKQPLLDSLQLWQLWDLDLPLATWRMEVVQWLYIDLPAAAPGQPVLLPSRYSEICAAHKLWMSSPLQLHIPLVCAEQEWEYLHFPLWRGRNGVVGNRGRGQRALPAVAWTQPTHRPGPTPHLTVTA